MQWLITNWLWLLIGVAFFALHLFGHRGHGGHGGHGGGRRPRRTAEAGTDNRPAPAVNPSGGGHQH